MSLMQLGRSISLRAQQKRTLLPLPLFDYNVDNGDSIHDISLAQAGGDLSQGTVLYTYEDLGAQSGFSGSRFVLNIGNGNWSQAISVYKEKNNGHLHCVVRYNGGYEIDNYINADTLPENFIKVLIKWDTDRVAFFINGVRVVVDEAYNAPFGFNDGIRFGARENGQYAIAGESGITQKRGMFWREVLSDIECERLTRTHEIVSGVVRDPAMDVVAFLGQSNAVGQGSLAQVPTYPHEDKMRLIAQNGTLKSGYSDPYADPANIIIPKLANGSYELSYAGTVIDALAHSSNNVTAALCCALSSTNISRDWNLSYEVAADRYVCGGVAFSALQMLRLANQYGRLKAITYHQGESDAKDGMAASAYILRLRELFSFLKREFNVPIILVALHDWHAGSGTNQTEWNAIKNAQLAFVMPGVHVVDAADASLISGEEVHLDAAGLHTLGVKIANKILSL